MRIALILFSIFVFLASTAFASSSGLSSGLDIIGSEAEFIELVSSCEKLKLDIVGSLADSIQIVSPEAELEDIEIVGSTAKNINIISKAPRETRKRAGHCQPDNYEAVCCVTPKYRPEYIYTPHMGVDAWYGRYWYASSAYLPRWPQAF
ncbi:MAG: hypothetical protein LUQ47_02600 [Methanotrichaceae archaeon]|nr:hypothetical protein [Methanotrichaceae archaeon]